MEEEPHLGTTHDFLLGVLGGLLGSFRGESRMLLWLGGDVAGLGILGGFILFTLAAFFLFFLLVVTTATAQLFHGYTRRVDFRHYCLAA